MIDQHFSVLAGVVEIIGIGRYAWLTYRGEAIPNLVSWVIWGAAPLIAFAASISAGVSWNSSLALAIGIGPFAVVAAALIRRAGYWQLVAFDYWCGALSVAALVLWYLSGSPAIALWFSMAADFFAAIPTFYKAYRHPQTESVAPYLAGVFSGPITLVSLQRFDFIHAAFPLYIFVMSALLTVVAAGWVTKSA